MIFSSISRTFCDANFLILISEDTFRKSAVARGSALFTTLGANGNVTLGDSSADTVSVLGSVLGNVKLTGQNAGGNLSSRSPFSNLIWSPSREPLKASL